jgi:hypothetical protein
MDTVDLAQDSQTLLDEFLIDRARRSSDSPKPNGFCHYNKRFCDPEHRDEFETRQRLIIKTLRRKPNG